MALWVAPGMAGPQEGQEETRSLSATGSDRQDRTAAGSEAGQDGRPAVPEQLRALQEAAAVLQVQLDELRIAFRKVLGDNAELKIQLEEKERTVRLLAENLAVWKTEAELFQKKWEQAHLEARAAGVKLLSEGEQRLQKQLAESVRRLYEVQQERDQLREQMTLLVEMTGLLLDQGQGWDPQFLQWAETQRDASQVLLQKLRAGAESAAPDVAGNVNDATFDGGRVLDFNRQLQLAVLNLGRTHGVVVGMPFVVLRAEGVVAHLKVVEVREKISGALVERWEKSGSIEVGDRVRLGTVRN